MYGIQILILKAIFSSYINSNKCLYLEDVENGKIKVDTCDLNKDAIFEYDVSSELIKSPLSPNECLGKGDRKNDESNADGVYLKPCNKSDDQVWQIWNKYPSNFFNVETQNVWVYNPNLKKCLLSGSALTYRPVIGNCVNSMKLLYEPWSRIESYFNLSWSLKCPI